MQEQTNFIEVRKVIGSRNSKENVGSSKETYNVSDIKGFRPWHKGENDRLIVGEMTQLIIQKSRASATVISGHVKENNFTTVLIEESYNDFMYRLSQKAVIKDIDRKLHEVT